MSKAEQTRAFIISRTAPLFNRKGVAGTSLNDLTAATGLSKGAIYGNFENKDEVAVAAFEYNIQQVLAEIRIWQSREISYKGKFQALLRFYRQMLQQDPLLYGCPIANTITEADDTHPLLNAAVKKSVIYWQQSGERLVQKGKDAGEFKSEANAEEIVSMLFVLIEGGLLLTKGTGKEEYLEIALKSCENLLETQLYK
jgi:AcrR family transcriptional regulator